MGSASSMHVSCGPIFRTSDLKLTGSFEENDDVVRKLQMAIDELGLTFTPNSTIGYALMQFAGLKVDILNKYKIPIDVYLFKEVRPCTAIEFRVEDYVPGGQFMAYLEDAVVSIKKDADSVTARARNSEPGRAASHLDAIGKLVGELQTVKLSRIEPLSRKGLIEFTHLITGVYENKPLSVNSFAEIEEREALRPVPLKLFTTQIENPLYRIFVLLAPFSIFEYKFIDWDDIKPLSELAIDIYSTLGGNHDFENLQPTVVCGVLTDYTGQPPHVFDHIRYLMKLQNFMQPELLTAKKFIKSLADLNEVTTRNLKMTGPSFQHTIFSKVVPVLIKAINHSHEYGLGVAHISSNITTLLTGSGVQWPHELLIALKQPVQPAAQRQAPRVDSDFLEYMKDMFCTLPPRADPASGAGPSNFRVPQLPGRQIQAEGPPASLIGLHTTSIEELLRRGAYTGDGDALKGEGIIKTPKPKTSTPGGRLQYLNVLDYTETTLHNKIMRYSQPKKKIRLSSEGDMYVEDEYETGNRRMYPMPIGTYEFAARKILEILREDILTGVNTAPEKFKTALGSTVVLSDEPEIYVQQHSEHYFVHVDFIHSLHSRGFDPYRILQYDCHFRSNVNEGIDCFGYPNQTLWLLYLQAPTPNQTVGGDKYGQAQQGGKKQPPPAGYQKQGSTAATPKSALRNEGSARTPQDSFRGVKWAANSATGKCRFGPNCRFLASKTCKYKDHSS